MKNYHQLFFVIVALSIIFIPHYSFAYLSMSPNGCSEVGVWDEVTKTCTLTQDVTEPISFQTPNATLDGNGYTLMAIDDYHDAVLYVDAPGAIVKNLVIKSITSASPGYGLRLTDVAHSAMVDNVVVQDFIIGIETAAPYARLTNVLVDGGSEQGSAIGIYVFDTEGTLFKNTEIRNTDYGIDNNFSDYSNFEEVTLKNCYRCLNVYLSTGVTFKNSSIVGGTYYGIRIADSENFTALNNRLLGDQSLRDDVTGIVLENSVRSDGSNVQQNEISGWNIGIVDKTTYDGGTDPIPTVSWLPTLFKESGAWIRKQLQPAIAWAQSAAVVKIWGNNFINNEEQYDIPYNAEFNVFLSSETEGGNYWDNYDEVSEGCADTDTDGYCDEPYWGSVLGEYLYDELPRTEPVTVLVGGVEPSCELQVTPESVTAGEAIELTFSMTDATQGVIRGVGEVTENGSFPLTPATTTTYSATVWGDGGSATCSVGVMVTPPPIEPPTCSLTATPSTIEAGESSTLTWTSTKASSAAIDNGVGSVGTAGEVSVSPDTTTTYTATFSGEGGDTNCQTTVTVNSDDEPLSLHERAAANAVHLASLIVPGEGYYLGAKGWEYERKEFVTAEEILSGYVFWNPVLNATTSDTGLDCSGLVMWAYNYANNPKLKPGQNFIKYGFSADQARDSQSVDVAVEDIQPGDVLFYNYAPNSKFLVDHVAMYVGDQEEYEVVNATDELRGIQTFTLAVMLNEGDAFLSVRRPINGIRETEIKISSPADIVVTDPDGVTITSAVVEVTNSEYVQSVGGWSYSEMVQGHDGLPADVVYSPYTKEGDYQIRVVPHENAKPDDTYSLTFTSGSTTKILVEEEPLSTIPAEGFSISVSEDGTVVVNQDRPCVHLLKHRLFLRKHPGVLLRCLLRNH